MNTDQLVSPDGRYEITLYVREVFNTHWLETPTLRDKRSGETLLAFADTHWSADQGEWLSDATVRLAMRKYPGNHQPGDLSVSIDCAARTGRVGAGEAVGLSDLEATMEKALTWIFAKPAEPPPNLLARLQRFLRGG